MACNLVNTEPIMIVIIPAKFVTEQEYLFLLVLQSDPTLPFLNKYFVINFFLGILD